MELIEKNIRKNNNFSDENIIELKQFYDIIRKFKE